MGDRIGFVGVGRMGANMARRLKDRGESITAVYDARRDIAAALAEELGCGAPETLAGVTAASDVIFIAGSIHHVGSAEQAATLKALVNMVMNINTAALAEGLALADAMRLNLTLVRDVFSQTGAASRVLETDGEDMQHREHSCFFSAEHAAKDSGIALKLAVAKGLGLPLAAATRRQYARMVKEGLGQLDKSGIAELTFKGRRRKRA